MVKRKWIQEVPTESATEFLKVLSPHADPFRNREGWIYRGHSDDAAYTLIPTALREESEDRLRRLLRGQFGSDHFQPRQVFQVWMELRLLQTFLEHADEVALPVPDMEASTWERLHAYFKRIDDMARLLDRRKGDDPEEVLREPITEMMKVYQETNHRRWPILHVQRHLAIARHNGIPTRLLDWSLSPRVAAYFAALGAARRHSGSAGEGKLISVWAFSKFARQGFDDRGKLIPALSSVRVPNDRNRNMSAQRGLFTVKMVEPEDLWKPIERRTADEVACGVLDKCSDAIHWLNYSPIVHVTAPTEAASEVLWWLKWTPKTGQLDKLA